MVYADRKYEKKKEKRSTNPIEKGIFHFTAGKNKYTIHIL